MKSLFIWFTVLTGIFAHANCLNIAGSYEIPFGMPECAAGLSVVKAWKKIEQKDCKQLSTTKVYKLDDGSFCEGTIFVRSDDGREVQNPGSEYASIYRILPTEHMSKVRHLLDSSKSFEVSYKLDAHGNLLLRSKYVDGSANEEQFLRSVIQ